MRVGVVTTSYPRFDGDAAGSFVAAHVAAMRAAGHDVEVISAQSIRDTSGAAVGGARRDDVGDTSGAAVGDSRRDDVGDTSGAARAGLFDGAGAPDELERGSPRMYLDAARFTAAMTARVIRRSRHWDLAIAHWLAPSALAALPSRTPLLAIAHGGDIHTLRRLRLLAPALYLLRARNARLAFVTEELRSIARAASTGLHAFIDGALVQPMGIDVARFAALGRNAAIEDDARAPVGGSRVTGDARAAVGGSRVTGDARAAIGGSRVTGDAGAAVGGSRVPGDARVANHRPSILVVARLVPIKGVDVALEAYRRLATPADLVIAGEGPERARLEALATTATAATTAMAATTTATATSSCIRFLGAVDASTRDQLLRDADLVVIPSRILPNGRSEGSPMIALEALAAGLRVVASAVGGLCDLPGIALVPPDDPAALAAAIDRALANPPPRVDISQLDWRHVCARLLDHARP